jgi:DeoR/GlpR family transcriptional regulator of sugar metabolism
VVTDLVASDRQQEILRRALTERVLRVKDLAVQLGVHEMTIRRDLDALADQGLLERVHGGARIASRTGEELSHHLRAAENTGAKARIARAALGTIKDGEVVAFDASTTALALARLLGRANTAIVTGLDAAEVLAASGVPFTLIGGAFHAPARSFTGGAVTAALERLHPDKVFFSSKGYTPEAGFTDAHLPEVEAKEALVRSGGTVVALLDHTKFGRRALGTIAPTDRVDVVVTDREPPPAALEAFERHDVRLVVANADPEP